MLGMCEAVLRNLVPRHRLSPVGWAGTGGQVQASGSSPDHVPTSQLSSNTLGCWTAGLLNQLASGVQNWESTVIVSVLMGELRHGEGKSHMDRCGKGGWQSHCCP